MRDRLSGLLGTGRDKIFVDSVLVAWGFRAVLIVNVVTCCEDMAMYRWKIRPKTSSPDPMISETPRAHGLWPAGEMFRGSTDLQPMDTNKDSHDAERMGSVSQRTNGGPLARSSEIVRLVECLPVLNPELCRLPSAARWASLPSVELNPAQQCSTHFKVTRTLTGTGRRWEA